MIQKYVATIAAETGLTLSSISAIEGRTVGCLDTHLLHLTSNGQLVSALVYQPEMDKLNDGLPCERLELRIRTALASLIVCKSNDVSITG